MNLIVAWAIVLILNSLKVAHVNFIIKWAIIKVLKYFHVSTYHTTDSAWHSCSSYTRRNVHMGVKVCSISSNDISACRDFLRHRHGIWKISNIHPVMYNIIFVLKEYHCSYKGMKCTETSVSNVNKLKLKCKNYRLI